MPAPWLPIPNHKQQHRADCLAACVAMVLDYLGLSIRYSRLLRLLDISPDLGAPAPNIHKLSDLGIAVTYRHAGVLNNLVEHIAEGIPCITFVNTLHLSYWAEATRHTVVVAGLDTQQVTLQFSEHPSPTSSWHVPPPPNPLPPGAGELPVPPPRWGRLGGGDYRVKPLLCS